MVIKQSCSGSHDNGPEMLQEMEETINMKLFSKDQEGEIEEPVEGV